MNAISNGKLLFSIGVIHNLLGAAVGLGWVGPFDGRNLFAEIFADGVVGAIETSPARIQLFWFLFFGFMTMALGQLMHRMERAGHTIPRPVAGSVAAIALGGGLLIPASGFWLVLPVAARIWWTAGNPSITLAAAAGRAPRAA
jgi:hypothetical protein